jgi:hypothetical protein
MARALIAVAVAALAATSSVVDALVMEKLDSEKKPDKEVEKIMMKEEEKNVKNELLQTVQKKPLSGELTEDSFFKYDYHFWVVDTETVVDSEGKKKIEDQSKEKMDEHMQKNWIESTYTLCPTIKPFLGDKSPSKAEMLKHLTEEGKELVKLGIMYFNFYYAGDAEPLTGNWKVRDNETISPQEFFQAIVDSGFNKKLNVNIYTPYSGRWTHEAKQLMDVGAGCMKDSSGNRLLHEIKILTATDCETKLPSKPLFPTIDYSHAQKYGQSLWNSFDNFVLEEKAQKSENNNK